MRQKAHRFKGKITTREDISNEFYCELTKRIDERILSEHGGKGILWIAENVNREQIRVEEKIKLLNEWESKGRSTAFNSEKIGELLYKKYYK